MEKITTISDFWSYGLIVWVRVSWNGRLSVMVTDSFKESPPSSIPLFPGDELMERKIRSTVQRYRSLKPDGKPCKIEQSKRLSHVRMLKRDVVKRIVNCKNKSQLHRHLQHGMTFSKRLTLLSYSKQVKNQQTTRSYKIRFLWEKCSPLPVPSSYSFCNCQGIYQLFSNFAWQYLFYFS